MILTHVSYSNLREVLTTLAHVDTLVFDSETTGLQAYHGAEMFSLAVADLGGNAYYFNFKEYPGLPLDFVLKPHDIACLMKDPRVWVAHNAKFDLHFTCKAGICPQGVYHDTKVLARLYENHHHPWVTGGGYSLDACAKRWLNNHKDDRVKKWMDDNGAYAVIPNAEGKDQKHYYFGLVPFDLISEYAGMDAVVTAELYQFLRREMYETDLIDVESRLTSALFHVEQTGVKIDRAYCEAAYAYEKARLENAEQTLREICGPDFSDSAKFLGPVLHARGFELPQTEKGNLQVTDKAFAQKPDDELIVALQEYRDANKRAHTYWSNYLFLADKDDIIHPSFDQAGTTTGRMSCRDPNLQNIPAEDDSQFPVRRAFIAREGFTLVSIDYAAMEFRLMLEYAGETELIAKIKDGHDPHQATADMTGLERKQAKTLNFMTIYGGGYAKIAEAIGVTIEEAKRFKWRYFDALPGVRYFIREATKRMENRGYAFNWAKRRVKVDDRKYAYKAPNYIIQGGSADIVKIAMTRLAERLKKQKSRMLLQVHDEIVFEVHESELDLIAELSKIMSEAYPHKQMPMACSIEWGKNLTDLEEYIESKGSA